MSNPDDRLERLANQLTLAHQKIKTISVDRNVPTPEFATFAMWRDLTGMSRSRAYQEIAKGNLRAVKNGRQTLIDVRHGLEWFRSLPAIPAKLYRPGNGEAA